MHSRPSDMPAKVADLERAALVVDEDVVRLHVAVADALRVQVSQAAEHLERKGLRRQINARLTYNTLLP